MSVTKAQSGVSAKLLTSFSVPQESVQTVNILSVLKSKLLVSKRFQPYIYIYDQNYTFLNVIKANNNMIDATWTPRGDILYSLKDENLLVKLSQNGTFISTISLPSPYSFLISNNDSIYIVSFLYGVFKLENDEQNWKLVIKLSFGLNYWQVINVVNKDIEELWIHISDDRAHRLFSCELENCYSTMTEKYFRSTAAYIYNILSSSSRPMACADNKHVILSDKLNVAVYVLPVNSANYYELLSPRDFHHMAYVIAVDKKLSRLYVGQERKIITVFQLKISP